MTSLPAVRHRAWFLLLALSACDVQPARTALDVTGAGSVLERVTTEPIDEGAPAISPDGRILLFGVTTSVPVAESVVYKRTLVAVDPNTRAQRTLYTSDRTTSFDAAWLPDGASYIYVSDNPGSLSLVRALTAAPNSAVNVIASGEVTPSPREPTLSPDGKRVAFTTSAHGVDQIAVIGSDGSRLTILGEGSSPAWGPDGHYLAFCRPIAGQRQLFVVDPDTGTNLVQLTTGGYDHSEPAWSPDGQFIVFSTNRGNFDQSTQTFDRGRNLFLVSRDGTGLAQLTAGNAVAIQPDWGRDEWIYFSSDQASNYDIWRLKPSGKYVGLKLAPVSAAAPPTPVVAPSPSTPLNPAPPAPEASTNSAPPGAPASGCTKDTDCKGDRICEKGNCVSPAAPAAPQRGP
jgi:TolB protein